MLPSSQISPSARSITPLPQFRVHTLGSPLHDQWSSTKHVVEHPSPSTVAPSSQVSPASRAPLPQFGVQTLGVPLQLQPPSTVHVSEQPSPAAALPSSHASSTCWTPSPHSAPQV